MKKTRNFLKELGFLPKDPYDLPTSQKRFPDGAHYRVEIPSVEGPNSLRAVIETAKKYKIRIHRVSQGSGIMLLTDEEIKEMVKIGYDNQIEVSLFVGPRGNWDINSQYFTTNGKNIAQRMEGIDQLVYAIEDIKRGCDLGIRSILVSDEGLLWLVNKMKQKGELPLNLVVKVSVQMGQANPVSIKLIEEIGANTFNVPTDLTLPRLAAIRHSINIPIDIYVEVPDDFGGFIRHYEIPEIIRVAAPVYIKFGLRNAPNIYPSGTHLDDLSVALSKERVRRAKIGLDILKRYSSDFIDSEVGAKDLGIPEI